MLASVYQQSLSKELGWTPTASKNIRLACSPSMNEVVGEDEFGRPPRWSRDFFRLRLVVERQRMMF
jgi:hypothetical protein